MEAADLRHELVPLRLATRLVNSRVYGDDLATTPSRLLGIAHAMAALCPLYAYNEDASGVRRLTDQELLTGHFRMEGQQLHFVNGRPSINNVAVAHSSIEEVVRLLTSARQPPPG